MTRQHITSGSRFEQLYGYSRAVVDEPFIFVAGTTGFDYATMSISPDLATQTRQCLANIDQALAQALASAEDVVRLVIYLADGKAMTTAGPIIGAWSALARPASTAIVAGFIAQEILIEIEATAKRRSS